MRGASLILIFFFTLALCRLFPPSSFCFHILLPSQPSSLVLVFPSRPFIRTSFLHHPTSHLLHSFHLSFVPLRFFFFYIWNGEGMLCLSYHLCITFPIQRERERERGREKRSEKEKEDWEEGMRGAEERKGAGARQKEKITLLPGLMNMGKGRSQ